MFEYILWVVLIFALAGLAWSINGLVTLNKADRIMTAYIDWKYENFAHILDRSEDLAVSDLFDRIAYSCRMHSDPFAVFSDKNREAFREWFKENESRY